MDDLTTLRSRIQSHRLASESDILSELVDRYAPTPAQRQVITTRAQTLITDIRNAGSPGLMEVFLAEYGLSTDEGIALMCLAEALLRVPDAQTIDDLIEDKIAPSEWGAHLGQSSSSLVNASTWALMITGKVLREPGGSGMAETLHGAVRRLGEPVIRVAVKRIMKEMGDQFVLGETIEKAIARGQAQVDAGMTYSYDMLGEAALTAADAATYFEAYQDAISALAKRATSQDVRDNPGISIKLSALHPRYEEAQKARVMAELVPRVQALAEMACAAGMGLNIDAEEADRLDLSLDVIEAVLRSPDFADWAGFGIVVQAYSKRASAVIDWIDALARALDRNVMVRLVKGAYWDTEIKRAQVDGVSDYPVFTRKAATDVAYLCCARQLLTKTDRIYPQFATHNAHTVSAVLEMADDPSAFEFQRLHGMGETLHDLVRKQEGTRCRIYAPVGAHRDLLAYLVRRLLENGANSSFVNQIIDEDVSVEEIARDPFDQVAKASKLPSPRDLFQPDRPNSTGWDLTDRDQRAAFEAARAPYRAHRWTVGPILAAPVDGGKTHDVINPSNPSDRVGQVAEATPTDVDRALAHATTWAADPKTRANTLNRAADLYEAASGELFAVLAREAGKTPADAVAELREAVDFLRYYAAQAITLPDRPPAGLVTCISPWNFPLAIFTGQISAALAAGCGVLAKPAEPTPIIASLAVALLHKAGIPRSVLQLLPGAGAIIGAALTSDPRIGGVAFTGSTSVSRQINRTSAAALAPDSTLIAETGGLNAMIVDSTALPEQAVRDIVLSAFRSAGQRCSALRVLYVQDDIADALLDMLFGAMDTLLMGDPWDIATDVGPVITPQAQADLAAHVEQARRDGRLLKACAPPRDGHFVGPAVISVPGIGALEHEVFGPILHVARFQASEIDQVLSDINASGYGLTFGLHTRIDDRVAHVTQRLEVGNLYVNRNQIGAVVGSQPFGGEGLSGTGPKAGGPNYVSRFQRAPLPQHPANEGPKAPRDAVQAALEVSTTDRTRALVTRDMPGPTGESNRWSLHPRGTILCLGPSADDARAQTRIAQEQGCGAIAVAPGLSPSEGIDARLNYADLTDLAGFDAVALWSDSADLTRARKLLAARDGPILPLIATDDMAPFCWIERHLCIDTTAAGGNATLLAGS
ncbi:MAG: bifunctional proline dehydrogenase/L-glutamate gamma-semialdehyde dehydrogenase PutA [Pseudomonadota bacterium]